MHPRGTAAGGPGLDFHEFRLLSGAAALGGGDSALVVTYGPRFVGGTWVLDSCFEEVPLGRGSGGGDDVDEDDGSSSFVWCATDHIPLADNPGRSDFERSAGGNGRVPDRAWDYAHINSVDKSPTGREYLVSARHLDTIYCVSAVDGSILWRLAGSDAAAKSSSSSSSPAFRLDNNWHFARQHDARFLDNDDDDRDNNNNNNSSLTVSFFNNANDGVALKNNPSRAVIARLDLATMTATKLAEYGDVPLLATTTTTGTGTQQTYLSSNGMGSVQSLSHPLSNGSSRRHILASFGRHGAMAEYDAGSSPSDRGRKDPIFYADFAAPAALPAASRWSASNYRTYLLPAAEEEEEEPPNPSTFSPDHPNNNNNKGTPSSSSLSATTGTWTGHPIAARPALWSYSRTPTDLQTFYVSWNGDTAARTYKFWISDVDDNNAATTPPSTPPTSPPAPHTFHVAGTVARAGFETNLTIGSARPWAYAEALDARGRSLANSTVVRNYVPSPEDAAACGRWHCFPDVAASAPAEWLLPLDDGAALAGGAGAGGASRVPGALALLEHILALCGLGFLALWLWMRMRRGSRDKKGYRPVGKEEGLEQSQYDGLKV